LSVLSLIAFGVTWISHFLWSPKFHYCVHRILLLDPFLSWMNPVGLLTSYKIHFDAIFSYMQEESTFKLNLKPLWYNAVQGNKWKIWQY